MTDTAESRTAESRTVRRRADTRERMLEAARTVLAREGIQGASVEHICEQAGFTRGAFYSNFSSKDDLVLALFDREREQMLTTLRAAADPDTYVGLGAAEAFAVLVDRFVLLHPQDREWFLVQAEFQLRGIRHDVAGPEFVAVWRQVRVDFEEFMVSVLDLLGLRLTVSVSHVSTVIIGTYENALREALAADRPLDLALLKESLPMMLLAVVAPASSM